MRKDGSRFWAHVVIDPMRDNAGELVGFAKITRDLTERQAAKNALKRSEDQFRLLGQRVADYAIYLLDPAGRVGCWNWGRTHQGLPPRGNHPPTLCSLSNGGGSRSGRTSRDDNPEPASRL
jgi:hypothetical protein